MEASGPVVSLVSFLNGQPLYRSPSEIAKGAEAAFRAAATMAEPFYYERYQETAYANVRQMADEIVKDAIDHRQRFQSHHRFILLTAVPALTLLAWSGDLSTLEGGMRRLLKGGAMVAYSFGAQWLWAGYRKNCYAHQGAGFDTTTQ